MHVNFSTDDLKAPSTSLDGSSSSIMLFLDKTIPQVELDNIHALILAGISTNKAEVVEVNGYGAIYADDEASNNCTVFALHLSRTCSKRAWNQMVIN